MTPLDLLILALATWYSAYVVVKLNGPFKAFEWLRSKGEVFTCIYCLSFWAAIGFALIWISPAQVIVYPFALAGGALMLHRYTGGMHT